MNENGKRQQRKDTRITHVSGLMFTLGKEGEFSTENIPTLYYNIPTLYYNMPTLYPYNKYI